MLTKQACIPLVCFLTHLKERVGPMPWIGPKGGEGVSKEIQAIACEADLLRTEDR